ncbi:F-box protein PP2-B10 [Linum grandiflorum]
MNQLPEDCIAKVMSYLGPHQSCRLATVSRTFSSASQSDVLWESFLPANYRSVISQSSDPSLLTGSVPKKELFRLLCQRPILIDQGKKSWMLEKQSGKVKMMLGARDLHIVWMDDPNNYWQWERMDPNCRFWVQEVAVLNLVWWLEIRGRVDTRMLSPGMSYAAYLVYKLTDDFYFFDVETVKVGVVGVGEAQEAKLAEESIRGPKPRRMWGIVRRTTTDSDSELRRVKLGEFKNEKEEDDEVEFFVMEVEKGLDKRGLVVHGIEIVPLAV